MSSTELVNTRSDGDPMGLLVSHRWVLEQYADHAWAQAEGLESSALVGRVMAAIDVQLRALDRAVTPQSVLLALWSALAMRLVPDGGPMGRAYLTAFYDKRRGEHHAALIVGVAGWTELLQRAGVTEMVSGVVCLDDFVGGARWVEKADEPPPVHLLGPTPPMHVPMTDPHLPDAWGLGYCYARRAGEWMHPHLIAGDELRTRWKSAKARNPKSYAHKHAAAWVRNQVVLRFARSRRVMAPTVDMAIASGMSGRELAAQAPIEAMESAEKLAELTSDIEVQVEDPGESDLSPAAVRGRES